MLEYNVSSIRDYEVFRMKRSEGKTGSRMFTGRLEKVCHVDAAMYVVCHVAHLSGTLLRQGRN